MTKQYEYNPAWADRILTASYDAVVARVGAERAPVVASESKSGKLHFEELGCGHYGCVMSTQSKDIVFKLTSDASEAAFVAAALSLDEWPTGLIRYYDLFELAQQHRGRRVFGLVRQEAYDVGGLISATVYRGSSSLQAKYEQRYGKQSLREMARYLHQWLHTAAKMRDQLRRSKDPAALLDDAKSSYDTAWHLYAEDRGFETKGGTWGPSLRVVRSWHKGATAFELRRILLEQTAMEMANTHAGYLIGEAFGFYLEHDLLLADMHMGNIGEADVEGHEEMELVITDPGHMVPLAPRWLDIRIEQLAA